MAVTRIENFVVYLSFDDQYIEMGPSVDDPISTMFQTKTDPRKIMKVVKMINALSPDRKELLSSHERALNGLVLNVSRLRLELVESVIFMPNAREVVDQVKPVLAVLDWIPGVGNALRKLNPAAFDVGGSIQVNVPLGSVAQPFSITVRKADVEKAKEFVAELESRIKNRGQKVEIVGIGLPTFTPPGAPEEMKVCPDCAEEVKSAARKCRFCGYEFAPAS
jgi:hypothetical protein